MIEMQKCTYIIVCHNYFYHKINIIEKGLKNKAHPTIFFVFFKGTISSHGDNRLKFPVVN